MEFFSHIQLISSTYVSSFLHEIGQPLGILVGILSSIQKPDRCWPWCAPKAWSGVPRNEKSSEWDVLKFPIFWEMAFFLTKNYIWSNYSDLTRPHPKWWWKVREIPLFQGNLGWWNIIIWPDYMEQICGEVGDFLGHLVYMSIRDEQHFFGTNWWWSRYGFLLGTSPYYLHEYLSRMIKKRVGKKALRQSSKQLAILLVTLGWWLHVVARKRGLGDEGGSQLLPKRKLKPTDGENGHLCLRKESYMV